MDFLLVMSETGRLDKRLLEWKMSRSSGQLQLQDGHGAKEIKYAGADIRMGGHQDAL
jgi:hypothetical protein